MVSFVTFTRRIWPKPFTKKDTKTSFTRQLWFVGLQFLPSVGEVTTDKIDISK